MTPDIETWFREVGSATGNQERVLLTLEEYRRTCTDLVCSQNSPVAAAGLRFTPSSPFTPFTVDVASTRNYDFASDATAVIERELRGQISCACRISVWMRDVYGDERATNVIDHVAALAASFWHGAVRDDKSRLHTLQVPDGNRLAEATVRRAVEVYGSLACFFCDLDNFKQVNDQISMEKGDDVILQFAAVLSQTAGDLAIPIHRSGDEFIVLFPNATPVTALGLGLRIIDDVNHHDFDTGDVAVGVSAGIAVVDRDSLPATYKDLEQLAEKSVKLPGGEKLRGQASLMSTAEIPWFPISDAQTKQRAICLLKGDPANRAPFESPWLNVISQRFGELVRDKNFDWERIADESASLIELRQLTSRPGILRSALFQRDNIDGRPEASPLDIAFAAANGIFSAGLFAMSDRVAERKLVIEHDPENATFSTLKLVPDGIQFLKVGENTPATETIELGGFHYFKMADNIDPVASRRALLIKIGHSALQVPTTLFADVLVVDDRPARGGELPDFWESVVARLIALVTRNPNIEKVYILGNKQHAKNTVAKIVNIIDWPSDAEYIAYKTGATHSNIEEAAKRLKGNIVPVENEHDLYATFASDLRSETFLPPLRPVQPLPETHRFLQRQLELRLCSLGNHDGCRIDTIASAYPIVVEIARKCESDELIVDQAGQHLRELVDFKVHLNNPLKDRIPAFYLRDSGSLEEYLDRAFLDDGSLFGSRLQADGQLERVLKHVSQAISRGEGRFATRRAILVIPHAPEANSELAPLGLVSIRIVPRFARQRIILHYSYTWRTVEVLVGFPYSIFGSVGYAEHLTKLIRDEVGESIARHIEIGQLSYVAHSLHIFMDEYGQSIARRIVDDASL